MEQLGYVNLKIGAKLSGIERAVLKERCELGVIPHAIKRKDTWYIPRSALFRPPDEERDSILNGLVYASRLGLELPVTLVIHGEAVSGWLTTVQKYLKESRDTLYQFVDDYVIAEVPAGTEVPDLHHLIDEILKGPGDIDLPYDKLFACVEHDPFYYDYCYLRAPHVYVNRRAVPLSTTILRVRVSTVDAHQIGLTESHVSTRGLRATADNKKSQQVAGTRRGHQ